VSSPTWPRQPRPWRRLRRSCATAAVDEPARAEPLRAELASRTARLADVERRLQALTVKSAAAGVWTPAAPTELAGRFVKRGKVVGFVVAGPSLLLRAAVTQEDMDLIRSRLRAVQVRLANDLSDAVPARVRRQVPGGEFDLVSPALGTSDNGEIAVDPSQTGGMRFGLPGRDADRRRQDADAFGQTPGRACDPLNERHSNMLNPSQLVPAAERVALAATRPATVNLFGSGPRGDVTEASDLDLVVIEPELLDKAGEYLRLKAAVGRIGVGVDLLLFAQRDFERRSQVPGTLPYWALKEGKVLQDAAA
jgi:predicted nucleotidyltransferase